MTAKNLLRVLLAAVMMVVIVVAIQQVTDKPEGALRLVVIPSGSEVDTPDNFQIFIEYLEEAIDTPIEMIIVSDYAAVIEALKYEQADMARLGPSSYVIGAREVEIEPMLLGVNELGKTGYFSYIISRPDLETLEGATFAFVDPGSASGYLYPNQHIETAGIQLGRVLFAGSHPAVIEAFKNGSVDAGAIASTRLAYALEGGVIKETDFKVFWSSVLIPHGPWVARADLDNDLKESFVEAMMNAPEDVLDSLGVLDSTYVRITDADYDVVREVY